MAEQWRLSIRRSDIADAFIEPELAVEIADSQVRFRLQRFALTANNVTYAAFGDAMKYWDFFPSGDEERGVLPVWGFGDVIESRVDGIDQGDRFYGIWPASNEAVLTASKVSQAGFSDGSPHRAGQAPVYLRYVRCSTDPGYDPTQEREHMTLQPLYATSFLLHRYLVREKGFGAERVIMTSASSKTAVALAELLKSAPIAGLSVHALTSTRSESFVRALELYDTVSVYDTVADLDVTPPTIIVDFAGNRTVNLALHSHLDGQLQANVRVGGAHWIESAPAVDLPGPKPVFFFAPTHLDMERDALGASEFRRLLTDAWMRFARQAPRWFNFVSGQGSQDCLDVYRMLVDGQTHAEDAWCIEVA